MGRSTSRSGRRYREEWLVEWLGFGLSTAGFLVLIAGYSESVNTYTDVGWAMVVIGLFLYIVLAYLLRPRRR